MSSAASAAVLLVALVMLVCSQADAAVRVRRTEEACKPNQTFKKDCNTCKCNSDGTSAACTVIGCLSRPTRDVSCIPGSTYLDKCNTCRCGPDGKSGACTRKACPPGSY